MPADIKVGSVSRARYDALVGEDRKLVLDETKIQFKIGDDALEIKPMRPHGGSLPATGEKPFGGHQRLEMFADDIGVSYNQVRTYRQAASLWPREHWAQGVSFDIHRILEKLDDRFEKIADPPPHRPHRRGPRPRRPRLPGPPPLRVGQPLRHRHPAQRQRPPHRPRVLGPRRRPPPPLTTPTPPQAVTLK